MMKKMGVIRTIPEAALCDAGITTKHLLCRISNIKDENIRGMGIAYTSRYEKLSRKGVGVCIYGKDTTTRQNLFYGIAKAILAQGKTVKVLSPDVLVSSYFDGNRTWADIEFLCVTEMSVPQDVINGGYRSAIYSVFRNRSDQNLPVLVATALPVKHPRDCLDFRFPGVGNLLIENTTLMNISGEDKGEWLEQGHVQM